jgi:hypothetical protein
MIMIKEEYDPYLWWIGFGVISEGKMVKIRVFLINRGSIWRK